MEIKAESEYTLTEKLFREGMGRVNRDTYGRTVKKALIALAVLWTALAAVTIYISRSLFFALVEFLVVGAAAWTIAVSIPRSRVKRSWTAMRERSGGEMGRRVRFYQDRLEVAPGGTVVLYGDVEEVLDTRRLLILITDKKAGVLVAKEGFTAGGPETVRELLEKRGRKQI